MLRPFVFGCGQGATKAMIACIEAGVFRKEDCVVVNSTTKDIPHEYRANAIVISDDPDAGCGKVREAAKALMNSYIKSHPETLNKLVTDDYAYVHILTTSEGASGSGSSVVLAQYLNKMNVPTIITIITGFESDIKGLQNTINYFKDLQGGDFVVNTISNRRYLAEAKNNIFVAESLANEGIAKTIKIINAHDLIECEQNIDDTDHYKIITNPGFLFAGEVEITDRIKNVDQFNKLIGDMIDNTTSLDFEPSATKVGVYMNMSEENLEVIDTSFSVIKKKLCWKGFPEIFIHKQYDKSQPQFIRVIASGINLPKAELMGMYEKFQQNSAQISAGEDDFFNALDEMDTNIVDSNKKNSKKVDFFDQFDQDQSEEVTQVLSRNRRGGRRFSTGTQSTDNGGEAPAKGNNKFTTKNNGNGAEVMTEETLKKF